MKPGDKKFTFNNAATATANPGTQYEEYPFSKALYASKVNGSFNDFEFSTTEMTNGTTKTAYLFTCDETRYNIAPTTATQHVYYAFYEMTIDMKKKTYAPVFGWEKVYEKDKTFYSANNGYKTDAMFGLRVTTESVTDDQGTHSGYVTVSQIKDQITSALTGGDGVNAPSSMDQILYIDASNLMNIVENQTTSGGTTTSHKLSELKQGLAANALIYLPYGSTSSDDNFAYNTIAQYGQTPIFRGAGNIVLTDKETFYAPYDIQVDAANKAEYKRLITTDKYGKVQNASLILPFTVELEDGVHTNPDGTSFSLHTMQSGQTLQVKDGQLVAYFPVLSSVSTAAANTPYLVKLDANSTEDNVSFIVSQNGATISKTKNAGMAADYTFSGKIVDDITAEGGNGAVSGASFYPKGTYAGQQVPKTQNIFYFASNVFVNSKDYKYGDIKVAPFRAYFATSAAAAKIASFGVTFEEEEGNEPDGIGVLSSVLDVNAPVYDLQGRMVATSYREAKGLQSGMYVVNGVKIIVK